MSSDAIGMITYRRLISAVVALISLAVISYLERRPSENNAAGNVNKQEIFRHDELPVLPEELDEEYTKAIGNRSALVKEYELENEYVC